MRKLFYTTLLTICLAPLFGGSVFAQSYRGTYTVSRLSGKILDIGIFFKRLNQHRRPDSARRRAAAAYVMGLS